ncbi:MAG: hypothetical protein E2P02_08110 [Acidobacteria bacterium]|nr:MAG: hypothetical protein E2P02_08110 [Acidobacteriota bacterium]
MKAHALGGLETRSGFAEGVRRGLDVGDAEIPETFESALPRAARPIDCRGATRSWHGGWLQLLSRNHACLHYGLSAQLPCTARVHVEDGRIVRLEPHTGNLATPEGVCLKGLSYVERTHSPDRLLYPLRRRPRTFEHTRISWDEALDTIAEKLERARDTLGPPSVFFYAASGTKGLLNQVSHDFWRLFGGYTTTYGDLCWPAGLEATRLTLGENKHSDPTDLARAKLIVMWGKNPAETNIHQTVFINDALEAGGTLVVIDPRRTETAERADLLIQPRPGTDGALALGLDSASRAADARAARSSSRYSLGRARKSCDPKSEHERSSRGFSRSRFSGRRRAVHDGHGARSRHRASSQNHVRTERRHQRLLARLRANQAESDRAAGRSEAGNGNVSSARRAFGLPEDGHRGTTTGNLG